MTGRGGALAAILASKGEEVARLKATAPVGRLKRRLRDLPPARDFTGALRQAPGLALVAEIKRASPSQGPIRSADPAVLARAYAAGGAAAVSVLTDGPFFGGRLADLAQARQAAGLPVLRKDFLIDPLQVYESRLAGADAVLLIVAALGPERLGELHAAALEAGLAAVVEVHDEGELALARELNPAVVAVNNRDLRTLRVSVATCLRLGPALPPGALGLAASGLSRPEDLALVRAAGYQACLIGTALMRAADPAAELKRLRAHY
jgi:indole-3-glycerol phosphate synthase